MKINHDMTLKDVIFIMSEGNPGAISVIMKLLEEDQTTGFFDILNLDDMNMRGSAIWIAYKDFCGCDLQKFQYAVRNRNKEMVELVKNEMERSGNPSDIVQFGGSN